MSKSSLIIGLMLAALAHGAIILPGRFAAEPVVADQEIREEPHKSVVVTVPPSPPIQQPKTFAQLPAPAPEQEPAPAPLRQVVRATSQREPEPDYGNTSASEEGDSLPTLRIIWDSPGQLLAVARAWNMKIVAINTAEEIVGEVILQNKPHLMDFDGQLGNFSNRVRTLPRLFFGSDFLASSSTAITSFWILVPAEQDSELVAVQREAIRARGVSMDQVRAVEAKFERVGGTYRLVVTRILMS